MFDQRFAPGLAVVLASLLAPLSGGTAHAQGSSCAFIRGDANGNGSYQPTHDFNYIMTYLYSGGPAPDPLDAGDANDDGAIGLSDATYLANYDNATGPAPPPPFSSAGFDPTPDENNTDCDSILATHAASLTSYLPSSASAKQDIRPLAIQRGVGLDGTLRARAGPPFHLAGNPFERAPLGREVIHEASGTYEIFDVDLALPASGFAWVIGRTYNARQRTSGGSARDSNGYQGKNWFQTSQPEIVHYDGASDAQDVVVLIYGADRFIEFDRLDKVGGSASTTFRATNGAAGVMVFTVGGASVPDTYTYTDSHGYEHVFFGFDGDAGDAAGQYWKTTDPDGQVAFLGHATDPAAAISSGYSSGRILYAYDTADRRYSYTYSTLDSVVRLTQVKAETKTSGTWASPSGVTEVGKVDYAYYTSEDHGDPGDLKRVTITAPLTDSGQLSVTERYYRYYEGSYDGSTNPGYPHHLKLILGPEGARNYDYYGAADATFDSDFLTATTDALKPYAEAFFTYDSDHRIASAWHGGACGCSGGLNGTHTFTYSTNGTDDTGYDEDEWRTRTVVERPDGAWVTLYFDEVGQPLARVVTDADPSGSPTKTWATVIDRDASGVMTLLHTPANITAYTHSTGSFTKSTSVGLVQHFVRETTPYLKGALLDRKWSAGTSGSAYLDGSTTYDVAVLTVGASRVKRPFVASAREYTQALTSGTTGSNLTTITTAVHSGTLMPETVTTTLPDVVTGNNGEGASSSTVKVYYNLRGENTYSRSQDGIITYREFTHGQLTKEVRDADTTSLSEPTGFESSGSPLDVETAHTYDPQGRRSRTTLPSGENKDTYYTQLGDRRLVRLSYNDVVSGTYYGPLQCQVLNHAGQTEATLTIGLPGNSSNTALTSHIDEAEADPIEAINGSWSLANLVVTLYEGAGQHPVAVRTYFSVPASLPGTDGTHYDEVAYGHDDSGRVWRVKEAHGTITRTVRDLQGNVTETWVGTNDSGFSGGESSGTDDMVKTVAHEYDAGAGGGNQVLTKTTAYVEGSTTGQRVTTYTNDVRGRRIIETRPQAPHAFHHYDNLGRIVASGYYSDTGGITIGSHDPVNLSEDRLALSQTSYDERGRVYRTQRHLIDAVDGSNDNNLAEDRWYDLAGRLCKVRGTELVKTLYDRLGRETHRFVLASDNDSGYAHVLDVAGDTVMVENQRIYDAVTGDVVLEARIDRHHDDDAGTGPLDANVADSGDSLKLTAADLSGRVQITAHWYDAFGRVIDTVAYGDHGGSTFDRTSLSVPSRSANALVTTIGYNHMGQVTTVVDPRGIHGYTGYDAAGRVTKQVANATYTPPSTVPDAPTGTDENQTVLYAYTDGLQVSMTADMPSGTDDQVTTYTYGTVKGTNPGDSRIGTKHLLRVTTYPDSEGSSDVVTVAYNAQGEVFWRKDQGENIHETTIDTGGRPTARKVTALGSGFDGSVRRVGMTYTALGQVERVTQYSDTSGTTVLDEVKHTWNGWGLLQYFDQDHDSAVGGSGYHRVAHTYATATGGRRTVRRTLTTLPSGMGVALYYSGPIDENASRVTGLKIETTLIAGYEYNGAAHRVGVEYPVPSVYSRVHASGYPGLDQFNRPASVKWTRDLATDLDFVDLAYSYDENSNVTLQVDSIHVDLSSGKRRFDVAYTMDDLDRVVEAMQGHWDDEEITDHTFAQGWTLGHTGNWDEEKLDLNGDLNYSDAGERDTTRSHNDANEITDLWGNTPVYDANGNMLDDGTTYQYSFDAFNRLVGVRMASEVVAQYRYNGLGYLIAVRNDVDASGDLDNSDPWYHLFYDERWRHVATYRQAIGSGIDANPKEQFIYHESGYGEATHRNDDLVRRDRDETTDWVTEAADALDEHLYYCQNWRGDVVALIEDSGNIVEWVHYSAYGMAHGIPGGDTNKDDACDASDVAQIAAWIDADPYVYKFQGDLNLDGVVGEDDKTIVELPRYEDKTLGKHKLSSRRNPKGYAGYLADRVLPNLRHVRHHVLEVDVGRWLQRSHWADSFVPSKPDSENPPSAPTLHRGTINYLHGDGSGCYYDDPTLETAVPVAASCGRVVEIMANIQRCPCAFAIRIRVWISEGNMSTGGARTTATSGVGQTNDLPLQRRRNGRQWYEFSRPYVECGTTTTIEIRCGQNLNTMDHTSNPSEPVIMKLVWKCTLPCPPAPNSI